MKSCLTNIVILPSRGTLAAAPVFWRAIREQGKQQHAAGHYRESERLFRTALADLQQAAPRDPHIPEPLNDAGAECHLLGRYAEAETFYRDALSAWHDQATPPDTLARVLTNLATTQRARGRYREAEASYREALQVIS